VQQRQSSQPPPDNSMVEASTLRSVPSRRLERMVTGAGAAVLALFMAGCPTPADLDDPAMYDAPAPTGGMATGGGGSGGSGGGGGSSASSCETPCMATVLAGCVVCHSSGAMLGKLDLMGDYTARLKDQPAKHDSAGAGCPPGVKLIESGNAANSWLLKKVSNQQGDCGTAMPGNPGLTGADLMCVQSYVTCVAGGG
jgi:hypothetical protein